MALVEACLVEHWYSAELHTTIYTTFAAPVKTKFTIIALMLKCTEVVDKTAAYWNDAATHARDSNCTTFSHHHYVH